MILESSMSKRSAVSFRYSAHNRDLKQRGPGADSLL